MLVYAYSHIASSSSWDERRRILSYLFTHITQDIQITYNWLALLTCDDPVEGDYNRIFAEKARQQRDEDLLAI
jgi:hypothetical protein